MDSIFRQLEKAGKADAENLLQWMKDSKIINSRKEPFARRLFKDIENPQHVQLEQFKEILAKIADEQRRSVDLLTNQLANSGPKFIDAAIIGIKALRRAFNSTR